LFSADNITFEGDEISELFSLFFWVIIIIFVFCCIFQLEASDEIDFNFDSTFLSHNVELFWSRGPLIILIVLGIPSISFVYDLDVNVVDYIFKVNGNQWFWRFEFLDYLLESKLSGVRVSRTSRTRSFIVLNGSSVRVNVCSQDVIHSFSIPILNVHVDATPRRNSLLKFNSYLVRSATATCQELCGHGHRRITLNLYFY